MTRLRIDAKCRPSPTGNRRGRTTPPRPPSCVEVQFAGTLSFSSKFRHRMQESALLRPIVIKFPGEAILALPGPNSTTVLGPGKRACKIASGPLWPGFASANQLSVWNASPQLLIGYASLAENMARSGEISRIRGPSIIAHNTTRRSYGRDLLRVWLQPSFRRGEMFVFPLPYPCYTTWTLGKTVQVKF